MVARKASLKKAALIWTAVLSLSLPSMAQIREKADIQRKVTLPDIPGYQTLKCDFHMHTVFSDGHVWPSFRVNEALRDGLDVISLTEHIDYEGFPDEIKRDYNRSYEIAAATAKNSGLLVIRGVEISPRVPPYHNNALFVKDANILPIDYMKSGKKKFVMKDTMTHEQLIAPFLEAKKQDAFVFYNHPGYAWWDKKDTAIFTSFHKELLDRKILSGVEVANSGLYNIIAHRLAMKYNLTMFCNTDEHYDMYPRYADTHRPMTLVFAKDKTEQSIKEALQARRTAVYFDDFLIAKQAEAESFFKAAITVQTTQKLRNGEPIYEIKLLNNSDIPFRIRAKADYNIEKYPGGQVTLSAHDTTTLILKAVWKYPKALKVNMTVENILVTPDQSLETSFTFIPGEEKKAQRIKVMSYNIHHGADKQEVNTLKEMGLFIKASGADLVGLQEVDSMCNRSGNQDQMKKLAEITGMHYAFVRHFAYDGGAYGLGILSRYPVSATRNDRISSLPKDGVKKSLAHLSVKVAIPGQKELLFSTVHFALDQPTRITQSKEVLNHLNGQLPVVLTGDLNAEPGTTEILQLESKYANLGFSGGKQLLTYPDDHAVKRIDYIMVSKDTMQKEEAVDAPGVVHYSDHLPLIAEMELIWP